MICSLLPVPLLCGALLAQESVSGKVTSADDGSPLPGVSVVIKGTNAGAATDVEGNYRIAGLPENAQLVFSFIGFVSQEFTVGSQSVINVQMVSDIKALSEVVIVGYGEQTQRFSTQSVSTVKSDAIKDWPVHSPQQLLQGQAAGVQMVNSSGVLGANSSIRIRGAASITAGGEPLFVVDGVPLNDRNLSFGQGGGTGLNPLMNINPNDIETMSVLKDASAVAIYGSRGTNGVVLITTKKGKKDQKTSVNVDAFTGFSNPVNLESMMNTQQFSTFVNERRAAQGLSPTNYPSDYFDWPSSVVRQGRSNSVNVSARGGSDKTSFFLAGNHMNESGFTIGNDMHRYSGRLNLSHQANKALTFGSNLSVSNIQMNRIAVENNTAAPLTSSYLQLPFVLPRDPETGAFVNTGFIQNVLARDALNTNEFGTYRLTGNLFADLKLLPGLTFRTDWGVDNNTATAKFRSVELFNPGGYAYRNNQNDNKWLTTNTLNYAFDKGKSSFGLLAGYSFETSRWLEIFIEGSGFASDGLPNISSASTPTTTEENGQRWALESQFVRANYQFNEKYLLEASARRDGSSRFGADRRYGFFWAASAGWIVSEEPLLKNVEFVNFLKITASYGTAGNDRIGNFPSLGLYQGGADADYAGNAGLRPTQVPNPFLTWEETAQLDFGITSTFYKDIFRLSVNYYDKNTTGMLLNVPYPFTTGFANAAQNVGSMKNTGIDVDFNARLLEKNGFRWSAGFNFGYLQNEVTGLPESAAVDADGNRFVQGSGAQRAVLGRSVNEFFLVRANGVNPGTGDFEWLGKDGEPTTTYSADNRVFVGSAIPKFVGGLNTSFSYKGVDLAMLFNFTYGNMVLIDGLRFTENAGNPGFNNSTALLNVWRQPGDNAFVPAFGSPTFAQFAQPSTLQLQNGSFLRLRNLNLGYSLPSAVLNKQGIVQSARLYLMAQNLFLVKDKDFRGPDPEVSANGPNNLVQGESFFALPQPRSVTLGVNIEF